VLLHIRDSIIFGEHNQTRVTPYITWIWDRSPLSNDLTVFTDSHLEEAPSNPSKRKVAILIEPPVISGYAYEYIRKHYDIFEFIFTFDESLLSISSKFIPYFWGTPWIGAGGRRLYTKNKMVSIIASSKNFAEGHRLRHEVAGAYKDYIDVMGNGYRAIADKLTGLAPYRYSIAIENCKINSYFTEKILDCFLTGTVPIYWGCPKIGEYFDMRGIISFEHSSDLSAILNTISEKEYEYRLPYIEDNFKRVLEYEYFERYIYEFLKGKI